MEPEDKVVYRITQITTVQKQCPSCLGVGKKQQKIGPGMIKTVECPHCKNGVARHEVITDVSLKVALMKVGIVNLIRNTLIELIKDKDFKEFKDLNELH